MNDTAPEQPPRNGFAALQASTSLFKGFKRQLIVLGLLGALWLGLALFTPGDWRQPPVSAPVPTPEAQQEITVPVPVEQTPEESVAIEETPVSPPPVAEAPPPLPPPPPAPDLTPRLQALEEELASVKQANSLTLARLRLLASYDRLKDAARSGEPFVEALAEVERQAENMPAAQQAIAPLKPLALHGVPGRGALRAGFQAAIPHVLEPQEDGSFMAAVKHRLSKIITIRRVGEQAGDAPEAIIARAEAALEMGNIAQALKETAALPEANAAPLAAWKAHAEAQLALAQSLSKLREATLTEAP